jgi:hypothetical protein
MDQSIISCISTEAELDKTHIIDDQILLSAIYNVNWKYFEEIPAKAENHPFKKTKKVITKLKQ